MLWVRTIAHSDILILQQAATNFHLRYDSWLSIPNNINNIVSPFLGYKSHPSLYLGPHSTGPHHSFSPELLKCNPHSLLAASTPERNTSTVAVVARMITLLATSCTESQTTGSTAFGARSVCDFATRVQAQTPGPAILFSRHQGLSICRISGAAYDRPSVVLLAPSLAAIAHRSAFRSPVDGNVSHLINLSIPSLIAIAIPLEIGILCPFSRRVHLPQALERALHILDRCRPCRCIGFPESDASVVKCGQHCSQGPEGAGESKPYSSSLLTYGRYDFKKASLKNLDKYWVNRIT